MYFCCLLNKKSFQKHKLHAYFRMNLFLKYELSDECLRIHYIFQNSGLVRMKADKKKQFFGVTLFYYQNTLENTGIQSSKKTTTTTLLRNSLRNTIVTTGITDFKHRPNTSLNEKLFSHFHMKSV